MSKEQYVASIATGYFSPVEKLSNKESREHKAKFPKTLCFGYAVQGIGCTHGVSGEEGKLPHCRKVHTPWTNLKPEQKEFVKAFAQGCSALKLLEE